MLARIVCVWISRAETSVARVLLTCFWLWGPNRRRSEALARAVRLLAAQPTMPVALTCPYCLEALPRGWAVPDATSRAFPSGPPLFFRHHLRVFSYVSATLRPPVALDMPE